MTVNTPSRKLPRTCFAHVGCRSDVLPHPCNSIARIIEWS